MLDKKHIAFISIGGLGTGKFSQGIPIINSFIENIAESYHVTVFSFHRQKMGDGYTPKGFTIVGPGHQLSFLRKIFWLLNAFIEENRKRKIDLLHALWGFPSGVFGIILKKIFNIPVVIHLQGSDAAAIPEIDFGVFNNRKKKWLVNWAYANADELIVLTNYQKSKLEENFNKKISKVIPYGVDHNIFKQPLENKELKPPYSFVHVAHINPVKDQRILLDAFKEIRDHVDAKLKIFGTDTLDGALQQYAKDIGIQSKVSFGGLISNKELHKHFAKAHILLHTSLYEAQGVSVCEAMASGVVVCGTHVGIIADLSGDCTISSPVGDSEGLAKNVINLLNNPTSYHEYVRKGLAWSEKHTIDWTANEFGDVYIRLLD